jgi:hypothetical protein
MKFLCAALLLLGFSGCTQEEAESADVSEIEMEEDLFEQVAGAEPPYTPQELLVKEAP